MSTALASSRPRPMFLDLVSLTKPRVTALVMATAAVGIGLAPGKLAWSRIALMLGTTALLVGAANALNCWFERDSDAFMKRTCNRPLPARRLDPQVGFAFGALLGLASLPLLTVLVNPVTGLLGAIALASYVWLYTPLKFKTPHAMIVGAVPGALPPLMGWTAVTGRIGVPGVLVFLIVFVWQMPHVIGLSIYRRREYANAGIKVLPLVKGPKAAQRHAIGWALACLCVSVALVPLHVAGWFYLCAALALGGAYLGANLLALARPDESVDRWGRRVFLVSLLYLPLLLSVLLLDKVG